MCIKATNFAGVGLIREKMGQTYVTDVNGNSGTGTIDITKKNHFINLMKYTEIKLNKSQTATDPLTTPDGNQDDKQQENHEEASIKSYRKLLAKKNNGKLDHNESCHIFFCKKKIWHDSDIVIRY